jgi:hypothetical protein
VASQCPRLACLTWHALPSLARFADGALSAPGGSLSAIGTLRGDGHTTLHPNWSVRSSSIRCKQPRRVRPSRRLCVKILTPTPPTPRGFRPLLGRFCSQSSLCYRFPQRARAPGPGQGCLFPGLGPVFHVTLEPFDPLRPAFDPSIATDRAPADTPSPCSIRGRVVAAILVDGAAFVVDRGISWGSIPVARPSSRHARRSNVTCARRLNDKPMIGQHIKVRVG